MIVKSERLIIRPRTLEEMNTLYLNEKDLELKQSYLEMIECMKKYKGQEQWGADWEIELKDGTPVGGICFKGIPDEKGNVEIGYGIDEEYRRNGYATEAVAAISSWALEQKDVLCVQAQTDDNNEISKKVLRKNGFLENGRGEEGPLFEKRK